MHTVGRAIKMYHNTFKHLNGATSLQHQLAVAKIAANVTIYALFLWRY